VVTVRGDLDIGSSDELSRVLDLVMNEVGAGDVVVVDLRDVTFMDCAGMRPLLAARRRLGPALHVQAVPRRVARLFRLADVDQYLLGARTPAGVDLGARTRSVS